MQKENKIFPLVKGKIWHYPKKPVCPVCKKNKVLDPHFMIILEAGACLKEGSENLSGPSSLMEGYMYVSSHGDLRSEKKVKANSHSKIDIAEDVIGGQFSFYFCSTKCLRYWFNGIVDSMEKQMKNKKNDNEEKHLKKIKKFISKYGQK